ncbi:lipid II:glycine glycyltransferase FemX [Arthrobacter sp. H14-L1]|uniref:lipid II:glycine glycyltransferase FemX n=1 Tax=Arthrobacter sp. H14-L1 TaxID=2996697 RepID=UPI00226D6EC6|nr:peptidoglycan bridge formation glycyltransferase FemA/FemB family protein [Arthrobacter sp. H14-L1]MCY0904037.1 peptidoglycan bridge formation glycyltransferase FemA/FemB family protein [Arthrobacter sp. H14-L1]
MRLRDATTEEFTDWDALVLTNPDRGELLQSTFFAEQKRANGWVPRFMVYDGGPDRIYALYLVKKVPLIGELWYSPKGPGAGSAETFAAVVAANETYAREHPGIFLFKLEPELSAGTSLPPSLLPVRAIQPNVHTVIIDLAPEEETVFASFRQRGRRSVRKAEKNAVTVREVPVEPATSALMYALYKETSERAGFYLRAADYYKNFWRDAAAQGYGSLYFAYLDDEVIAGIFVTHFGTKALYKDGASSRSYDNTGAAHLLQWETMKALKARGVLSYDLHTTPPADQLDDKNHPSYGLGQFKTSFSNEITSYVGTLDQAVNKRAYGLWTRLGERAAQSLSHRLFKRIYY